MTREEAIQIVKTTKDWGELRLALQELIPELRESEDERARKELILYFNSQDIAHQYVTEEKRERWVSYLEKQKEQKLNNIELIQQSWYMEGYQDRGHNREPKWIVKTGEGGPKYLPNLKYGQKLTQEQKPIEWSEEDEIRLKEALEVLDESIGHLPIGCGYLTDVMNVTKWLKSLRPQPKQEWSEDDKRILYNVIAYVGYAAGERGVKDDDFKEANEWLKNLRYHTSWKPSEEQMKALEQAIVRSYPYEAPLSELYKQLKKL